MATPTTSGSRPTVASGPKRRRDYLRALGPGVVAGAADVDPTTVATMAVIGATTVYALSWLTLLLFPVLAVIQMISSRAAVCGGGDLQTLVRSGYGRVAQFLLAGSILAVTVLTIAADLEGGSAALGLITHLNSRWLVLPLAVAVTAALLAGSFDEIQKFLKYLALILLAYVVAAVLAHPNWLDVARHTVVPTLGWGHDETAGALALIGTSLTSYVYVWQTIELAEERPDSSWLRPKQADAAAGIAVAVAIFWFILIATAATLGQRHQPVQTAQDAAAALAPAAGPAASIIFGVGLLGSALLALPVLMATAAHVVGAEFDWRRGLTQSAGHAPAFYTVITVSVVLGTLIAFTDTDPIRLLFLASIAGGVATPVGLAALLLVASNRDLMNGQPIGPATRLAGWAITALISAVTVTYLIQQFTGS